MEEQSPKRSSIFLPVAILIAAILISGALVYSAGVRSLSNQQQAASVEELLENPEKMKPVSDQDHIRGDLTAPVKLVTFEDTECPFCKRFHPTMQKAMKEFEGRIAWVYRHFPLDAIHSQARKEAEATECAAELGGNAAFWSYLDRLFEVTPSNDGLDLTLLPKIAQDVGLDRANFESCLASGRHASRVAADLEDAIASGGSGTPYTVIVAKDGSKKPISGALPYAQLKLLIEEALR